jgi:oxalate decarboxylase/phosphoglucose isomerase-like protein (cupin superfamily)
MRHGQLVVLSTVALILSGCTAHRTERSTASESEGLVLAVDEGERRVLRVPGGSLLIIKVDPQNGGSQNLVMGYGALPPGEAILPHRHPHADEIIFVHRGSGVAVLGSRETPVREGATIYIPRNRRVSLRNTGSEPLAIAFFFSSPGFEDYMRDLTAPEGQPLPLLSEEELAQIHARHASHIVLEQP